MDNQEFFTKSVAHLRKQNARARIARPVDSTSPSPQVCTYRTVKDGVTLMCAVGGVIPEHILDKIAAYVDPHMPNDISPALTYSVGLLIHTFADVHQLFLNVSSSLLKEMQIIHDINRLESWETSFRDIAEQYNLILEPKAAQ